MRASRVYRAATGPMACLENVMVYEDGTVDFDNVDLTSNGRGCAPLRGGRDRRDN